MTTFVSDQFLAERYDVTTPTIWRWVKTTPGFPQPIKLTPGTTRWRMSEIEAFEAAVAADPIPTNATPSAAAPAAGRKRGRPRKVA